MASKIWEPVDRLAAQLQHGLMKLEVKVSGGKIVLVKVEKEERQWTLQDVQGPTLVD